MKKLNQIITFINIVEEHSFAAAARKQQISAAAISRQIANLENEIGAQLFTRSTRQVLLTEIGKQYYLHCKKAVEELHEAERAIAGSQLEATGELRIMTNRYFAQEFIIPELPKFLKQNPKLRLNFHLAERFPNLEKENIDILFGVSIEGSQELVRRRFATTRYVLCASPAYLKKRGIPKTPNDLQKHRYITHTIRTPSNIILFKNEMEVPIEPIISLNDTYAMRACALNGLGLVNLHDYMIAEEIANEELVEVLREYQEDKKNIYLYYQQSKYLQPKIRKFIDFFVNLSS